MSDTFIINRGSDLVFQFNWKDSLGANANLTGYTLFLRDVSASIESYLTAEITTAASGLVSGRMEWNDSIEKGRLHHFRIGIRQGSNDYTTNLVWVDIR
jgi:hypothetical protein